jgi:hypothetical protein
VSDDEQQVDASDLEARLRALDSLPVDEHVAIYEGLHRELRDGLAGGAGGVGAAEGAPAPWRTGDANGSDAFESPGAPHGAPGPGRPENVGGAHVPERPENVGGAPRPAS